MRRFDRDGQDVTDYPLLWSEEDCEIVTTQYATSDVTSGQHTNGPASIWIRRADHTGNAGRWICTALTHMHKVMILWKQVGIDAFDTPDLTDEERALMSSIPADAVSHWANGEKWDGKQWVVLPTTPPDADDWRNEAVYSQRD